MLRIFLFSLSLSLSTLPSFLLPVTSLPSPSQPFLLSSSLLPPSPLPLNTSSSPPPCYLPSLSLSTLPSFLLSVTSLPSLSQPFLLPVTSLPSPSQHFLLPVAYLPSPSQHFLLPVAYLPPLSPNPSSSPPPCCLSPLSLPTLHSITDMIWLCVYRSRVHGEATTFGSMYLTTIPRRDTWRACSKRTALSGTQQTNIVEEKVTSYQLELGK